MSQHEFFRQIITLSGATFAAGLYETAYHLLQAALHLAASDENIDDLMSVERLAEEQKTWIDAHAPDSTLSTESANKRGGKNLYAVMIRQIQAHITMIRENRRRRNTPVMDWPEESGGLSSE